MPAGNPTFLGINALPEIWSFGLRNPWRYSFDDLGAGATGALVIADVGQNAREEIDFEPTGQSGRNYGWRVREGTLENYQEAPAYFPLTAPVFEYPHASMNGEAITGGYLYRGSALGAAYQGRYFYADCVQGRIFSLGLNIDGFGEATAGTNTEHTSEMGGPFQCIGSFARDTAGELYFMDFGYSAENTGRIFRIDAAGAVAPGAPTNLAGTVQGNTVSLTWNAPSYRRLGRQLRRGGRLVAGLGESGHRHHHGHDPGRRRADRPVLRARARGQCRGHECAVERRRAQRGLLAAGGPHHASPRPSRDRPWRLPGTWRRARPRP